jgi:hypothetical protein
LQADLLQSLLHLVELERLDDGFDLFHVLSACDLNVTGGCAPGCPKG